MRKVLVGDILSTVQHKITEFLAVDNINGLKWSSACKYYIVRVSAYLIINYNEINKKIDPAASIERFVVLNLEIPGSQLQFCNKFRPISMCLKMTSEGGGHTFPILPWRVPSTV